jgi:peptidoglycan-associated lipoprotein
MSKTLLLGIMLTLAASVLVTGCSSKKTKADQGQGAGGTEAEQSGGGLGSIFGAKATGGGISMGEGESEPLDTPEGQGFRFSAGLDQYDGDVSEGRTSGPMLPVYFAFDSSRIEDDQIARVEHNAEFIKENRYIRVRIEGNCDERGSREYNLALGERRADAAKRYLINLGVDADQLSTVSWGEERPLTFGQNERAWSMNRRADFVLTE